MEGRMVTEKMENWEKYVSGYWMTLRRRGVVGNSKRTHQIALCGELAVKEAMAL